MTDDSTPVRSDRGTEILAYAMGQSYCVLEFTELDDGEMHVTDVTDHLRQLEKMHINNDPAAPMDLRTTDDEN